MERPTVDVVIPTYKPGKIFEELLRRLSRQTYPVTKIVIMNTEEQYWPVSYTHLTLPTILRV